MKQFIYSIRPYAMIAGIGTFLFWGSAAACDSFVGVAAWVSRYNGPASANDGGSAMAVDAAGDVFVTGSSDDGTSDRDYVTLKYDGATGALLWSARYAGPAPGGDFPHGIAVDNSGDVIVTGGSPGSGMSPYDYATVKYDGDTGAHLWTARYNGPVGGTDQANAIVVDEEGDVIVTGHSDSGGANSFDYTTIKYDGATGASLWTKRSSGPGFGFDSALAVGVDAAGNIAVTGYSNGGATGEDCLTIKYAGSNGATLWTSRFDGTASADDQARALSVDPAGDVIITGFSRGATTNDDYLTIKYNGVTGSELWTALYDGPASSVDRSNAVALGLSGKVAVTGFSDGGVSSFDLATVLYDGETGATLWTARLSGPGSSFDSGDDVAVDANGDVIVVGGFVASPVSGEDAATIKYDGLSGASRWMARYNGPGSGSDGTAAVAVDAAGSVLVTGGSYGGGATGVDFVTIKYSEALAANDLTASALVSRGGLRKHLATGRFAQVVTVKNVSASTFSGPISLALDNLSPTATLFNKSGDTLTQPVGSPYRTFTAGSLAPGASLSVTLEFTNPGNSPIAWTPRVLAGTGVR